MHFRKDLYFQKNNRGRHVLYCCSAHASWSPFPRKDLRFHKNNREARASCIAAPGTTPGHRSPGRISAFIRITAGRASCIAAPGTPPCSRINRICSAGRRTGRRNPSPRRTAISRGTSSSISKRNRSRPCLSLRSVHSLISSLSISRKKDIKIFPPVIFHTDPMTGIRARTITNCQLISGCRPRSAIYIQRIIRFVIMNSALFFHSHLSFNRFPSHFSHKTAPCAGTILIIS